MKSINKYIIALSLGLFALTANATVVNYVADDPNLPIIFQGGPTTINSTFNIADAGIINDLNISLNINAGFFSDLSGTLTSPDGTVVELFQGWGGIFADTIDIEFDDEAPNDVSEVDPLFDVPNAIFNPFFDGLSPEGALSDFDDENLLGDWTLTLTDSEAFFIGNPVHANTLMNWSITVSTIPEPGAISLLLIGGLLLTFKARRSRK